MPATMSNRSLPLANSSPLNVSNIIRLTSTLQPTYSKDVADHQSTFSPIKGAAKDICFVVYILVLFFGFSGNIVVIYVVGYRKRKRNSGDIYMLSLACADFLATIAAPLVMINDLVTHYTTWLYGEAMCYALPTILQATICASGWSLVFISLDRYRVISQPFAHRRHWFVLYSSVAFIWLTSLGSVIPLALQLQLTNNFCYSDNYEIIANDRSFIYQTVWVVYAMIVPFFIMSYTYHITAREIRSSSLRHANNRAMEQRMKQNAKIVKMFCIVISIFFIFTMPYTVTFFYFSYMVKYDASNPDTILANTLTYIFLIPATANGCLNPFIYARMHRDINGYIKGLFYNIRRLFRRLSKNKDSNGTSSTNWNSRQPNSISFH